MIYSFYNQYPLSNIQASKRKIHNGIIFGGKEIPIDMLKEENPFNTISWCFLTNLLIELGFPPKWTSSMLQILKSSQSRVRVNRNLTSYFRHARGLRQGDPLSPMLFVIVADSLNWLIKNSLSAMHPPIHITPQPIQYADNTVIIAEAHPTTSNVIALILSNYEQTTGLRINRSKSSFVPVAIPSNGRGNRKNIREPGRHRSHTWDTHSQSENQKGWNTCH